MERPLFVHQAVDPVRALELHFHVTDVALGEPVALVVRALGSRPAVRLAGVLLDLPGRDVVLGVGVRVESIDCQAEAGG